MFGATGRTGRHLLEQALAAGHDVTAFARDPGRVPVAHPRLSAVRGDVLRAASVEGAVQGQDAVLSALGTPARRPLPVLSEGIRNVLDAMEARDVRRIVVLSTAGAMHEDGGSLEGNLALGLGRRVLRGPFLEHARMLAEVGRRDADWIVVRAMLLTNGPRTGRYRVALEGVPHGGLRISRADVADFMLTQLASREYVRQMPAIAY
ncbi:MAG TPA: SDR family oxidoreductase [Thermoplasmata archaeon]|nr:SDR family oxidoreductase [Thermoplasmata archaeon]